MSTAGWDPEDRIGLVDHMATLRAADTEQFFGAYGLGDAYSAPGQYAGRKSKINAALLEAERRGDIVKILEAASTRFHFNVRLSHSEVEGNHMPTGKIFISHASHDRELAALLKQTLILGGAPQGRVFFSSERGTGVPLGLGIRQHLQETLRESALVVELLSEAFLTRPYCLMELGAAWVLDKPTFPIVVPPLTRDEAVRKIGDVQMSLLGGDQDIDDLIAELQDGIRNHAGIDLRATDWINAARRFKSEVPKVIAAGFTVEAPVTEHSSTAPNDRNADRVESQGIVIQNFSVTEGRHSTQVHGEATNTTGAMRTVSLTATFYNQAGRIIGTATGLAPEIGPGEMKTFTVSSLDPIGDYARYKMQIDNVF